ncbi:MAG: Ldh family oxidoreductase [Planctomycetales bacterium]|nr:Ldh family oxidoreductase [Planctomycetales bacterium]
MSDPAAWIDEEPLQRFTHQCFLKAGVDADDARRATDVLLWATVRGVDTHGIRNLKSYYIDSVGGVGRRDGVIRHDAKLELEQDSDTTAALCAHGALGLAVATRAMELAMEKAEVHGVGMVTVRNSTHFGAAGYYAYQAVARDMIGFASTGYLFPNGQPKAVVPFGGLLPMLSTNPIAMAFPTLAEAPFVLDMSTSVVPVNRIEMLQERNQPMPLGWALDKLHHGTTDPEQVDKVVPLGGAVEHGGHKGYGLALASWIMTGLLSGAWREDPIPDRVLGATPETRNGFAQEGIGHVFAAVRLDRFGDPETFKRGIDSMIRTMNESPPAPGFERVEVPGQREQRTAELRRRDGIPLPASTLQMLESLSEEFQLPLEFRRPG